MVRAAVSPPLRCDSSHHVAVALVAHDLDRFALRNVLALGHHIDPFPIDGGDPAGPQVGQSDTRSPSGDQVTSRLGRRPTEHALLRPARQVRGGAEPAEPASGGWRRSNLDATDRGIEDETAQSPAAREKGNDRNQPKDNADERGEMVIPACSIPSGVWISRPSPRRACDTSTRPPPQRLHAAEDGHAPVLARGRQRQLARRNAGTRYGFVSRWVSSS